MSKKIMLLVLALMLVVGMCACGNSSTPPADTAAPPATSDPATADPAPADPVTTDPAQTYEWKAANVLAAGGAWDLGLQEFARLLNEKSGGAITLEIFNGGTLGQERDTIEGLQIGSVDFVICSSATLSNFTDTQNIWDLPYLFQTTEAARGVLDSQLGADCLVTLSDVGIKGLSYWENGMYILGSTKPIREPADMDGLRIRCIESSLQADLYAAFNANGVVIPWGDIYTSLQQGVCDVTTTTLPNMYSAKQHEVAKYITQANQIYGPAPLLMSQELWDSLPADIQTIVQEAADEAKAVERDAVDAALTSAIEAVTNEGCEVIQVDTAEFAAVVEPLYAKYVGTMGITQEMFDAVRAEAEQYYK